MNCSTTFSMKMESKKMATKALEIMKSVLAQTDADGFEYDSRETFDRFADNLVVKGSEIIDTQSYGLMPETYHIVLPEMFKAVARCFCFDKFSAKIYYDSTYLLAVVKHARNGGIGMLPIAKRVQLRLQYLPTDAKFFIKRVLKTILPRKCIIFLTKMRANKQKRAS